MRRIVLFGDSITAGYREGEIYPTLTEHLEKAFPEDEIINVGIPGNDTNDGMKRLEQHVLAKNPDKVSVFFGANDAALHHQVPLAEYEANLRRMIEKIGPKKVILLSPPMVNFHRREDRPREVMTAYGDVVRKLAGEYPVTLLDIGKKMAEKDDYLNDLQEDGLHFSEAGYAFLAAELAKVL